MWEGVDNSLVWLIRSPLTVSHWTSVRHLYIIHVQKHAQDIFFLVPTSLTNCSQSRSSEHCSDSSHVTAPYKLLYFINQEKPPVGQKLQKNYKDLFGSAPYTDWSSSIKPSCSKTELNR